MIGKVWLLASSFNIFDEFYILSGVTYDQRQWKTIIPLWYKHMFFHNNNIVKFKCVCLMHVNMKATFAIKDIDDTSHL